MAGETTTDQATAASTTATPAWHEGKVSPETIGFWQNKGYKYETPHELANSLTESYRNVEKLVGVKPERLIRIPEPNAAEADVKAYWSRIGVPAESKDYDFSAVKFSDGTALDQGFVDDIRAALHEAKVPGDRAAGLVARLVKREESELAAEKADYTEKLKAENDKLNQNWGNNRARNLVMAEDALRKLSAAAGLTEQQGKAAWDNLAEMGNLGAAATLQMLLTLSARMGEAPYIAANNSMDNATLSRESARVELDALKKDNAFYARLMAGDREANTRWKNLQKVAFAA